MIRAAFLRLERDHELRERLRARATGIVAIQAITAYGRILDELAELVELRRRILEDVA